MYFNNVKDLNELKSQYRKMAFELHPDRGGDAKKFSDMQKEYERLYQQLKLHKAENSTESNDSYEETEEMKHSDVDDGFKAIIELLIHLKGINIELCGGWLWLSGNTKEHKDKLKAAGCRWSAKKVMWYWRPNDYKCPFNRHSHSMTYIRLKYGSKKIVSDKDDDKLPA